MRVLQLLLNIMVRLTMKWKTITPQTTNPIHTRISISASHGVKHNMIANEVIRIISLKISSLNWSVCRKGRVYPRIVMATKFCSQTK